MALHHLPQFEIGDEVGTLVTVLGMGLIGLLLLLQRAIPGIGYAQGGGDDHHLPRITSYNVCYTKLLRNVSLFSTLLASFKRRMDEFRRKSDILEKRAQDSLKGREKLSYNFV